MINLITLNYPFLEHTFMVLKKFEALKFYCIHEQDLSQGQDSSPDSALPIT